MMLPSKNKTRDGVNYSRRFFLSAYSNRTKVSKERDLRHGAADVMDHGSAVGH